MPDMARAPLQPPARPPTMNAVEMTRRAANLLATGLAQDAEQAIGMVVAEQQVDVAREEARGPITVTINPNVPEGNAFMLTNRALQRMASAAARQLRDGINALENDPRRRIVERKVVKVGPEKTAPDVLGPPSRKIEV